ncbi:hypothetical protein BH11MYX3_BH11MYX3_21890 [soil metagenome]
MIRRIGFVGLTLGLWLAMAAGLSLAPGCYNVPEPVCGFFCGSSGACPADYTCMADNRCHLNGAAATMCFSIDAGPSDAPDAPGDTPFEGINQPPMVVSTNPSANATGVAISTTVTVTFSEGVTNVSGTTFTVTEAGNSVSGTVAYSPTNFVASFTPSAALLPNTVYTAQLGSGISDLQGAPLTATSWTFTTAADTTAPMVVSTTPAANATGVAIASTVQVIFTEPVINATMTTFTLSDGATPISGTVTTSAVNSSATFTPLAPLPANTLLTATLAAGITDAAGNPLASAPVTWTFTTVPDTVAPMVVTRSPAASATGVPLNATVVATFDEAVNASMASFTLTNGGSPILGVVTTNATSKTATFTPMIPLPPNKLLTATLTSGVTDLAGNPLPTAPVSWSFTTVPDTVAPMLVSTSPAANATGVSIVAPIVATFDEAVINATTTTFTLMDGGTPITGTVTINAPNKTATFTPASQLPGNTVMTITLTSGITDAAGNPLAAAPISRTFTTGADTVAPSFVNSTPANSATMVATSTAITVTFNEPMANVTASTFLVNDGASVAGMLTPTMGARVWTFQSLFAMTAAATVMVTLTTGITDTAGNPLAAPVSFSFMTQ